MTPSPAKKPALGSGARFAALTQELARRRGVNNPEALAASIGRRSQGAKKMGQLAAAGRRRSGS